MTTIFFTGDPNLPANHVIDGTTVRHVTLLDKRIHIEFDIPMGSRLVVSQNEHLALTRAQLGALTGNYIAALETRHVKMLTSSGKIWPPRYMTFPGGSTLTVIRLPDDLRIEDITQEQWDKAIAALENRPQEKKRRRSKKGG